MGSLNDFNKIDEGLSQVLKGPLNGDAFESNEQSHGDRSKRQKIDQDSASLVETGTTDTLIRDIDISSTLPNKSLPELQKIENYDVPNETNFADSEAPVAGLSCGSNKERGTSASGNPNGDGVRPVTSIFNSKLPPTSIVVKCPRCRRKVGATRFAPHLEKCMNRGASGRSRNRVNTTPSDAQSTLGTDSSNQQNLEPSNISPLTCLECKKSDFGVNSILCDSCDRCFHVWCLNPRLREVPKHCVWFCKTCACRVRSLSTHGKFIGRTAPQKLNRGCYSSGFEAMEFFCDLCTKKIQGSRWRCLVCYNFDCCVDCYEIGKSNGIHSSNKHSMVQLDIE